MSAAAAAAVRTSSSRSVGRSRAHGTSLAKAGGSATRHGAGQRCSAAGGSCRVAASGSTSRHAAASS